QRRAGLGSRIDDRDARVDRRRPHAGDARRGTSARPRQRHRARLGRWWHERRPGSAEGRPSRGRRRHPGVAAATSPRRPHHLGRRRRLPAPGSRRGGEALDRGSGAGDALPKRVYRFVLSRRAFDKLAVLAPEWDLAAIARPWDDDRLGALVTLTDEELERKWSAMRLHRSQAGDLRVYERVWHTDR